MDKIVAYITSGLLLLMLLLGLFFFFARKKSMKLFLIYFVVVLIYAGVFVLGFFYESMELATSLAQILAIFATITMVVVYQNEFKTIFFNLSKTEKNHDKEVSDEELRNAVDEIVKACQTMSKARTGALIVIAPTRISGHIIETGTEINGLVTAPLLESVFNTKAPIHDGAVIVKNNTILAAGCFLPLSQTQALPKDLGTRHRAAIGITEETDMVSIVVSEENGIISVAKGGELRRFITPEKLGDVLNELYGIVRVAKKRYVTNV